jgi:hypothetical protein
MKTKTYIHYLQGKNMGKVKIWSIDKERDLAYDEHGVVYCLSELKPLKENKR